MEDKDIKKLNKLLALQNDGDLVLSNEIDEVKDTLEKQISKVEERLDRELPTIIEITKSFMEKTKGDKGETPTEEEITPIIKKLLPDLKDGITPVKDIDYFDGKDGLDGQNGLPGANGKDGIDGLDGQNGLDADEEKIIAEVLAKMPKPKDGQAPEHQWNDTFLRFKNPDGTWGQWINLQGENAKRVVGGMLETYIGATKVGSSQRLHFIAGSGISLTASDEAGGTGVTISAAGGAGLGDVVGPASATDNAVARFDLTTGKLIQNSSVTISDTGGIATTIAAAGNTVGLTVTQNDTTNNPRGVSITNTGTAASLFIDPNGVTGASTSTGGAILLENTGNTGAGLIIYSNAGASSGRLMNIRADNVLFDQPALHIDYDGVSNVFEILQNSTDISSNAISVVSINPNDSTVGITGQETGKGTMKITHKYTGTADTSASAISLVLDGTSAGTAAQGIFLDSTVGQPTTGKLLNFRQEGVEKFTVSSTGVINSSALTASEILGTDASKNLVSLAVATYPSLTELSYVKGVTSAIQTQLTAKMTNPMTTGGDVIYGGASGTPTRLANGTAGQFLKSQGTTLAPIWDTPAGTGDMVLASAQTNSGVKTFLDTTMKLRNVANTFNGYFVNTNTADRIYTLQNRAGTLADDTDLALKANLASPTFTGTVVLPNSQALVTPVLGTPTSGTLTNCTGLPATSVVAGTLGTGAYTMDTSLSVPQIFNAENAQTATTNAITFTRANRINKVANNSAAGLTITLSTTGAVAGDMLIIKSVPFSAVAQTITWVNTEISDVTPSANLNASTTSPRTDGFMWNSLTSKWRCVASA